MSSPNHPANHIDSEVLYARHGRSWANEEGNLAGGSDSPLTEEGIQQAHELAQNIIDSGTQIDRIIASPLQRAFGTAAIVAIALGIDPDNITKVDGLRERSGGDFEGRPIGDFYRASDDDIIAAGGEGFDAFATRVRSTDKQVRQLAGEGNTLVVGHAEYYRMAKALELGLQPKNMMHIMKPGNSQLEDFPLMPEKERIEKLVRAAVRERPRPEGWGFTADIIALDGKKREILEAPWTGYRVSVIDLETRTWGKPDDVSPRKIKLRLGDEVLVSVPEDGDARNSTWVKL